jgi:hypothetical protein
MEHNRKFFTSVAVTGLACVLLAGSALALPAPSLQFGPMPDQVQAKPVNLSMATGARTGLGSRGSELSLAQASRDGAQLESGTTVRAGTNRASRSKTAYLMSGLVLAAMATPIALHRSNDGDDASKSMSAGTRPIGGALDAGDAIGGRGDHDCDDHPEDCECDCHCDDCDDDDGGGGGGGGGGGQLPEPGTVPLIGAGLMVALAFRRRRP